MQKYKKKRIRQNIFNALDNNSIFLCLTKEKVLGIILLEGRHYALTACIISQAPCFKYFAGGVLNIMNTANASGKWREKRKTKKAQSISALCLHVYNMCQFVRILLFLEYVGME